MIKIIVNFYCKIYSVGNLPKEYFYMNTKDKMQLLNEAIQSLMALYQILDDETPKLCVDNSELKKIGRVMYYPFRWATRRTINKTI